MENLFIIEANVQSWNEAIELCCKKLHMEGIVEEAFYYACIEREEEFPTGLPAELGVAIPHADSKYVKKDGICFLRMANQVPFKRLDAPEQLVGVNYVINLATKNPNKHLEILQKVMAFVQDSKRLNRFLYLSLEELKQELSLYLST